MKAVILFLFMMNSAHAWVIVSDQNKAYLRDSRLSIKEEIFADSKRKELTVKDLTSDLILITYLESIGGTTQLTSTYNCALYSKKLKKLVFKDNLCKTVSTKVKGKQEIIKADIKIEREKVTYSFEQLTESYPLK